MIYLELFLGFLKVGLFSFGGAYGAIPLIREVVLSYGWIDEETLTYMIAVSESTPGPIMVNLATYIGSDQAGVLGALTATFASCLPAFVIILLLMAVLKRSLEKKPVKAALSAMKACVTGIVVATGLYMIFENIFPKTAAFEPDIKNAIVTLFLAAALVGAKKMMKKRYSPLVFILFAAAAGIAFY